MGKFANPEVVAGALNVDAAGMTEAQQIKFLLQDPSLAQYIVAISVAAVFFGANTYIGNGPNFMVKSIADQQKVNAPSFLGYVFKFTIPYMIPMVLIIWFLFFR
jgi:Na+/H+ antiporter NhaD/arsenite permease-like protein